MTPSSTRTSLVVLSLLAGLLMGLDLGASSLHNQDEAKHAVVARELATHGGWLSLTYNDRPYLKKPPLRIWLTALTFRTVGVNEWTVRFWSAVFGVLTILALFVLGRRIYGERTAFLSALILLTSHQYVYNHCVRTGETDSMLIFCWTVGLLLLQLSVEEARPRLLYLAAVFLGLCGLVKHLGFVPLVLLIATGWIVLSGEWRSFSFRTWSLALGTVLGVALPWHLYQWITQGKTFIEVYFLGEIVEKRLEATGGGSGSTRSGPWTSLVTMARGFFPWSFLLPLALVDLVWRSDFRRRWLLPLLWLGVALGATVLSGRKFTWYVLPAFPAGALIVGGLIHRFLEDTGPRVTRFAVWMGIAMALASSTNVLHHNPFEVMARQSMLAVRFLGQLDGSAHSPFAVGGWVLAIVALGLAGSLLFSRIGPSASTRRWLRRLLMGTVLGLALFTVIAPLRFSRTRSPLHQIALAVDQNLTVEEVLLVSLPGRKTRNPFFHYYLGDLRTRTVAADAWSPERLAGELLLTDVATFEQARESAGTGWPDLEPMVQARGYILLRWP